MIRKTLYVLGSLALMLTVFLFWGSSANGSEAGYAKVVNYPCEMETDSDTFNIITYNIGYLSGMTNNQAMDRPEDLYKANLEAAKKLFQKLQPELIAFQEIDFGSDRTLGWNQLDSLALACQFYQGAYAVNWDKRYVPFPYWPPSAHFKSVVSGQAVLSKFPITENKFIKLQKPNAPFYYNAFYIDRLIQISLVKLGEKTLALLNVHLEAFDESTRQEQAQVLAEIVKEYASQYPVLLVGDFNSNPSQAKSNSTKEKMMDLFYQMPELREAIPLDTFLANESVYYTYSSRTPYLRIDYIFYTHQTIEPIEARVLKEAGETSDHLPLMLTFKWKENGNQN